MKSARERKRKTLFGGRPVKPSAALSEICFSVTESLNRPFSWMSGRLKKHAFVFESS